MSTFALPSKDFKVCQITILRKIMEISRSNIIMNEWTLLSHAKCFHCYFQTAPAISALALTYLTIFPLPQQIWAEPPAPHVSVCSYPHPTLLLSSAASQSLAANAPSGPGAWDSCSQQRHPWQVDSSSPTSSWVAGFRPLSSQNESCLLRARAGWLRARTSRTTQLLTGASIDTGKKL